MIDDIADVYILENAFSYDVMEVCLYKLEDQVNISIVVRLDGFIEFNDVRVLDLSEDFDLSICTLGISSMLEGVEYFLEGKYLFGRFLFHFPHMTVSSRPNLLENVKSSMHMFFNES